MGWSQEQNDTTAKKDPFGSDELLKDDDKCTQKLANISTNRKRSYLDNLGASRSPTARH
jgi:hypothetical protein